MASGVGYAVRSLAEHVEVIGIQPVSAPAMALSWHQRTVVETNRIETIADGVAGRCPIPEVLDDLLVVLDDVMLVGEDRSRSACGCSMSTRDSSSSRPQRLGSPPSCGNLSGSPGRWPWSFVVLTVERSSGAVVAGPDLVSRGFVADDADALFDEAREHVLSLVSRLTPDAGYNAWQGAIPEGLSRFLYKKTKRRPLILPLVTEV